MFPTFGAAFLLGTLAVNIALGKVLEEGGKQAAGHAGRRPGIAVRAVGNEWLTAHRNIGRVTREAVSGRPWRQRTRSSAPYLF